MMPAAELNGSEAFTLLSILEAFGILVAVLAIGLLLSLLVLLAAVALIVRAIRSIRARRRQRADESELLDEIAQEIAYCYGHGPLRVMDPAYQHEFRRDARAALAVMRGR